MKKVGNNPHSLPFSKSLKVQKLQNSFDQNEKKLFVNGLYGSSKSFFIKEFFRINKKSIFWILNDKETAAYHLNDLENFMDNKDCCFFLGSYKRNKEFKKPDSQNIFLRTEIIKNLSLSKQSKIIISYPEAIFEKVLVKKEIKKRIFKLSQGEEIELENLNEKLFEYDFNRVDFVSEPGDFSVRGGIVDVFSYSNKFPFRIEFFGNEIESIRTFEIDSQISKNTFSSIEILADLENKDSSRSRESIFNLLDPHSLIVLENNLFIEEELNNFYKILEDNNEFDNNKELNNLFYNGFNLSSDLETIFNS
jgi:transcription-repair coupling factor (superfamily II helicase)